MLTGQNADRGKKKLNMLTGHKKLLIGQKKLNMLTGQKEIEYADWAKCRQGNIKYADKSKRS